MILRVCHWVATVLLFETSAKVALIVFMGVALFLRIKPAKENIVLYYSSVYSSWRQLVVLRYSKYCKLKGFSAKSGHGW